MISLARPLGTLLLLLVPLTGYGFAHWDYGLAAQHPAALLWVLAGWTALSAGALWLNAALDGEEQGALFASAHASRTPPSVLTNAGWTALAVACGFCSLGGAWAALACVACSGLAVLYSHPRTRWKAHPLLGPAVNGVGYGVLSWLAGWSVAGVPMSARTGAAMGLLSVFVVGMSLAAQAYQREDDARRGYRTLVVTHGPAVCLAVASACTRAVVVSVAVLAAAGVYPRLVLLGLPAFVLAERSMRTWRRAPDGGTPAMAARFLGWVLAGGVVLVGLAALSVNG